MPNRVGSKDNPEGFWPTQPTLPPFSPSTLSPPPLTRPRGQRCRHRRFSPSSAVLDAAVVRVGVGDDALSFYPLGFDSGASPWSVPPHSRTLGFGKDVVAVAAIPPAVVCWSYALLRLPPWQVQVAAPLWVLPVPPWFIDHSASSSIRQRGPRVSCLCGPCPCYCHACNNTYS